jgi:phage shock protein E
MSGQNIAQTFVDVRSPEEYKDDHVAGAINIPLDQVQQRLPEFKEMAKPIITYCRSGNRSGTAVRILRQNGITDTINGGGIDEVRRKYKT